MRLIYYILAIVCICFGNADAQSFAADSGVNTGDKTANSASAANADAESIMKDAVINIIKKGPDLERKPEPTYDNTDGKVIGFKIIKGKVVFDDDKDRKILVFYDDFSISKGMDNLVRCKMRIYVLNDMTERLNNFGFKLIWPEISTSINLVKVNPGVKTYRDIMLLGDGCFSMDKNPTIEVNRCRVKGKTEEECAGAVKWFRNMK